MRYVWLILLLFLAPTGVIFAGDWHVAGTLECGDCHLQHGSNQRDPSVEGAFSLLLRKSSVNELCLSCHDGTDASAPDILSPTPMYSASPTGESSAGILSAIGVSNPSGHSIGLESPTPLQQVVIQRDLSCVSCHSSHGNGNYRNLLTDPANTGTIIPVVQGQQVFVGVQPANPPSASGSIAAYERNNIGYASGFSAWCASCHDMLATNSAASIPAHYNAHPSDLSLNGLPYDGHTDIGHWLDGVGEGFSAIGSVPATPRVPFVSPTATDFQQSRLVSASNQVSCMSCHKAHGSANRKGMVWPYLEGGETMLSGCQQCHNK